MHRRTFLGAVSSIPVLALATPAVRVTPPASATVQKPTGKAPSIRRIGIAFGGGSMHGIAHVGVLKAFIEKGVKFDFIAGTSVGAIVGVLAAAKLPYREIEALTRRIEWPGLMNLA